MKITVMSSNVWGNCPDDRPIADRDDKMAAVYLRYLPDSIGLQECSLMLRYEKQNLFSLIEKEYTEIQVTPTNEDKNNYTPIVYRPSKLELIDSGWLYFSGLNDMGSKSVTWALFLHKETNTHFIHINTHYYWTKDPEGQEARISNSHELTGLYKDIIKKYPYPVVITGDFNCRTDSEPIKALFDAGLAEARLCAKQPVIPYRSSHKYPEIDDSDPENITYPVSHLPNAEIETSIDHIFVTPSFTVDKYHTVIDKEALESSDHCPLIVYLEA